MTSESIGISGAFTSATWADKSTAQIYTHLEVPTWAPWLAATAESLAGRAHVFAPGQLVLWDEQSNMPAASLSTNRISWNGDIAILPSWDDVAGDPTTYEHTYDPHGNTLTLMSMNVRPDLNGKGLARKLIEQVQCLAQDLQVQHLIGSFRPNEYGKYKLNTANPVGFAEYCALTRPDGLPVDGWIRNLTRNGMKPLKVDSQAMIVSIPISEFNQIKQPHWKLVNDQWECGEVGSWTVNENTGLATYIESNLWGYIPF